VNAASVCSLEVGVVSVPFRPDAVTPLAPFSQGQKMPGMFLMPYSVYTAFQHFSPHMPYLYTDFAACRPGALGI
jgi:hypothetical protein